jgi:hypothetical protein
LKRRLFLVGGSRKTTMRLCQGGNGDGDNGIYKFSYENSKWFACNHFTDRLTGHSPGPCLFFTFNLFNYCLFILGQNLITLLK